MKRKTKNFICGLSIVCCGALVGAGLSSINTNIASAEEVVFKVASVALRVPDEEYGEGIRFKIVMSQSIYTQYGVNNLTTGVLLLPTVMLGANNLTVDLENEAVVNETGVQWVKGENGLMETYVHVYDIDEKYYTTDITIRAYIADSDSSMEPVYTSATSASVAYAAKYAYDNDPTLDSDEKDALKDAYLTYPVNYYVDEEVVETTEGVYGQTLTAPTVPEKEGCVFDGWWNKDYTKQWNFDTNIIGGVKTNLYAKFISKEELNTLLKMDSQESVGLFTSDWPTTYIPTLTANGVQTVVDMGCTTTIDLKSLYQLKDISSITISYYILADSNGWQNTSLYVNGVNCKDLGYISDGQGTNLRTITITKAELEAIGLTEESYIENCAIVPYYNYGARTFCVAGIVFNEYVEVSPEDALNELLQMNSQESAGLFTSDWQGSVDYVPTWAEETGVTFKLVSGGYGTCNVVMNMGSVYSVADVDSITIVYSLNVGDGNNGWADTILTINGKYAIAMGHVAHDSWGMNAPQTQERTLTITKADLLAAGLTETDLLESFGFWQTGEGIGFVTIKNITVAKYEAVSPEEALNALLQMNSQESAGLFTSDWQGSVDYVPTWAEETGVTFKLVSGNYGTCNVAMNMGSVYSVADVDSITIVYTLNVGDGNNGWAETILTINGQYAIAMGHVAHNDWGMNAPQIQERTLTITKADLLAAGLTEANLLESFAFSQTGNGIGFVTIKNITVA